MEQDIQEDLVTTGNCIMIRYQVVSYTQMRLCLPSSFLFQQSVLVEFCVVLTTIHDAYSRSVVNDEVNVGVLLPAIEVDGKLLDQPTRALQMAFDEINRNSNNLKILPNTSIHVVVNNTGYDRWRAIEAALWQVNVAKVVAIIGGADASEVKVISPVVKEGNIPLVSPSAVEYELNSETLYPTFFRIGAPDDSLGRVVKDVIDHFSWRRIAVIHSDDDYGMNGVRYAIDAARALGYNDIRSVYLEEPHGPQLTEAESAAIRSLKDDKYRIFVVVLHAGEQAAVLRAAAEAGMFEAGYAWVIAHCNYGTDLFVPSQMDGIICIRQQINHTVTTELWGMMQNSEYKGQENSMWLDSVYAYNAANSIAQALDVVLQSGNADQPVDDKRAGSNPDYRPTPSAVGQELLKILRKETFSDETGTFALSGTSKPSHYDYLNYHNGEFVLFATHSNHKFALVDSDQDIQIVHFPGDQTIVPLDTAAEHHNTLSVLVPISFPFTDYIDKTTGESCVDTEDQTNCEFIGVAIQLIKHVTSQIGLSVNFTLWTDSWNELVKQVGNASTEWDLAAGSVTVTSLRAQHATFSSSIYDSGLRILILRPPVEETGYFEFFKPFSWSVWLLIVVTLISAAGVMLYVDPEAVDTGLLRAHPNAGKWNRRFHSWADAIYFASCTFFAVHRVDNINQLFSRIYVVVLCFWVLIMVSAYTANMAAFLTHRSDTQSIRNYKDLSSVPVGCRPGTSNWNYVKNELSLKNVVPVDSGHHGVRLLKQGDIKAYIADTPHVLGLASEDCDVVVVGPQEQHQKYAFPMKPTLPYHNQINKAILEAVESEYVTNTLERVLSNVCPPLPQQDDIRAITLDDIGGLFMLSGAAGVILVLLKLAFLVWRWFHKTKRAHKRRSERKIKGNSVVFDSGINGTYSYLGDQLLDDD